jgi:hypothetical protein
VPIQPLNGNMKLREAWPKIEANDVYLERRIDDHEADISNPHNVTATQVGAETPGGAQAKANEVQGNLNTHVADADVHTTLAEKAKLTGIQAGAEVNQNAFSKVSVVGQSDVDADSKTDTLTMEGGTGITITTDPATDKVIITATGTATPGAHASSHINGGADVIPNAVAGGNSGLMSGSDKALIDAWPEYMARQALINWNFNVPQRGTSFTNPVSGTITLDRWRVNTSPDGGIDPTIVHSKQAINPGDLAGSADFYRINVNGAGSGFGANAQHAIEQRIEHGTRYLAGDGKEITVSFWARSSISGKKIGIFATQLYGSGGSPSATENINGTNWTLTNTWQKFTHTFVLNTLAGKTLGTNNDDFLLIRWHITWGSSLAARVGVGATAESFVGAGNIDIAQAQVCAGDVALPHQPKLLLQEINDCLRYAWVPQTNSVFVRASSYNPNTLVFDVPLPAQLRTTPTVRGTVNTDIVVNTVAGVAQSGFTVSAVLTSSGVKVTMTKVAHGLTDAYLEIKLTSGFDSEL